MRTSNPAFGENVLRVISFAEESTTMTVNGMVMKTLMALAAVLLTAGLAWLQFQKSGYAGVQPYLWGGLIVGLIAAVVTFSRPTLAPYTTPVYALAQGAFL